MSIISRNFERPIIVDDNRLLTHRNSFFCFASEARDARRRASAYLLSLRIPKKIFTAQVAFLRYFRPLESLRCNIRAQPFLPLGRDTTLPKSWQRVLAPTVSRCPDCRFRRPMEELKFYLSRSATTRLNLRTLFLSLSTTPAELVALTWRDSVRILKI